MFEQVMFHVKDMRMFSFALLLCYEIELCTSQNSTLTEPKNFAQN